MHLETCITLTLFFSFTLSHFLSSFALFPLLSLSLPFIFSPDYHAPHVPAISTHHHSCLTLMPCLTLAEWASPPRTHPVLCNGSMTSGGLPTEWKGRQTQERDKNTHARAPRRRGCQRGSRRKRADDDQQMNLRLTPLNLLTT